MSGEHSLQLRLASTEHEIKPPSVGINNFSRFDQTMLASIV
jgi:hypothetical protein